MSEAPKQPRDRPPGPEHPPGEADPTGTVPMPTPMQTHGEATDRDEVASHANVEVESGPVDRERREDPSPELP